MYHINLGFILKIRCILCVVGTIVNHHKCNIKNNGEYIYVVKYIKLCSYSDYGCICVASLQNSPMVGNFWVALLFYLIEHINTNI